MNKVFLIGRLTRDPELRYTSSNIPVARFTIAVNRTFANQSGEREADRQGLHGGAWALAIGQDSTLGRCARQALQGRHFKRFGLWRCSPLETCLRREHCSYYRQFPALVLSCL